MVFVLGIASACLVGFGFVLQQRAAQNARLSDFMSVRLLFRLIRMPQWRYGIALMIAGQIAGAFALDLGEVSLVEPLLATNLLFALLFARFTGGCALGRQGWYGLALLSVGVTVFITGGSPTAGEIPTNEFRHWLVFGSVIGLAAVLVAVGRHMTLFEEATLLAGAAGVLFGLQDALTHVAAHLINNSGFGGMLIAWQPYALIAVAAAGQVLLQSSFEAAPLRMSLPAATVAEPLIGIACGMGLLGDHLRLTGLSLAAEVGGLLCCVVGVVMLGRHPALPDGVGSLPPATISEAPVRMPAGVG